MNSSIYSYQFLFLAFLRSLKKLNPLRLLQNPVIFITEVGAFVTTIEWFLLKQESSVFYAWITFWLWLTVLFANFAESIAEMRNQAQANALREGRVQTSANLQKDAGTFVRVNASDLKKGDIVKISEGEIVPGDGEIIDGAASIDESLVTGEVEPVIRAVGTDRNSVISGTKVVSDQILVRIACDSGHSFVDRMIDLIEDAKRKKSHNEVALTILLSGLTFMFLVVILAMEIFGIYFDVVFSATMMVSLLICLIPTTIAGLLSAIGIAGINRLMKKRVLAMNGQAVEAAGDINLILIDKTGTITEGKRYAVEVSIAKDVEPIDFVSSAYFSSIQDLTDEGRSIVSLLKKKFPKEVPNYLPEGYKFFPFTAQTRMSGCDFGRETIRKGSLSAIEQFTTFKIPDDLKLVAKKYAEQGGTPLVLSNRNKILGVILLKDTIKPGLSGLFLRLRSLGIRVVMMTGDNPITAAAIAKESGVDEFLADASPEKKLEVVQQKQEEGWLVAMTGDGVNDAPALAYADVGVAMNSGTQAAKEAGNMIDLDSNPQKLFEIIEIGKQMLMTRGTLTTFSIANDLAKYFAIIPAILMPYFPMMKHLNLMGLATPESAVLSAVIFNALIIPSLIPLAFRGVKMNAQSALLILRRNLAIYGLGGIMLPFIGIKGIDMILRLLGISL